MNISVLDANGNIKEAETPGTVNLATGATGVLPVANGGTNNTAFTAYSVLTAGTTSTGSFQNVSGVGTTGQVLTSNDGAALPSWQTVNLASNVTGTLPVANGGTGDASLTAYAVLCGGTTSTGAVQQVSGTGTAGQILTSNDGSALPSWQNPGGVPLPNAARAYWLFPDSSTAANVWAPGNSASTVNTAVFQETGTPGIFTRYTVTTTGALARMAINVKPFFLDNNPTFIAYLRTGSNITNIRLWAGFNTSVTTSTDSDTMNGTGGAMFRYSTVASDGGWVGVTKDAGGQSVSSTVATISASTLYTLKIVLTGNGTNAAFSVNGGTVQNLATHILTGTNVGMIVALFAEENATKNLDLVTMYEQW